MAPDEAGCRRIVAAVEKAGVMLAVGHVMRYTPYTRAVKQVVGSGQLGDIMSVEHLEPVGFWHQAHSYVRGNWRRADWRPPCCWPSPATTWTGSSTFFAWAPLRVSSFGQPEAFHWWQTARPAPPTGAWPARSKPGCPYSAPR